MDVQLLVAEAVGLASAREVADLGAEDVAVEGVRPVRIGDGDDRVIEAQMRLRYLIASRSAFTSRWKTSMSMSGFSARLGMRCLRASSYVGSSAW